MRIDAGKGQSQREKPYVKEWGERTIISVIRVREKDHDEKRLCSHNARNPRKDETVKILEEQKHSSLSLDVLPARMLLPKAYELEIVRAEAYQIFEGLLVRTHILLSMLNRRRSCTHLFGI